MTLPAIIQKQQDKVTVTKVKKAYSIFSQAYARAIEANGGLAKEEWNCSGFDVTSDGSKSARCYMSYIIPYIKNVENCYMENGSKNICSFSSFRQGEVIDGKNSYLFGINGNSIGALSDGGGAYTIGSDGIEFMAFLMFIVVKTDRQPKNVLNKNVFLFKMDDNRLTSYICAPASEINHYLQGYIVPGCLTSSVDWILMYSNLDYMRCPDKVEINGKHSCR